MSKLSEYVRDLVDERMGRKNELKHVDVVWRLCDQAEAMEKALRGIVELPGYRQDECAQIARAALEEVFPGSADEHRWDLREQLCGMTDEIRGVAPIKGIFPKL